MGVYGQICYGLLLKEEVELPWDYDGYGGDINKWWLYDVLGCQNPFELFNGRRYWFGGIPPSQEKIDEFYQAQSEFLKSRGGPSIVMVNAYSNDYPLWIVAIPETVTVANRGCPIIFSPLNLFNVFENKQPADKILIDFCNDHKIKYDDKPPQWYLSSYWG